MPFRKNCNSKLHSYLSLTATRFPFPYSNSSPHYSPDLRGEWSSTRRRGLLRLRDVSLLRGSEVGASTPAEPRRGRGLPLDGGEDFQEKRARHFRDEDAALALARGCVGGRPFLLQLDRRLQQRPILMQRQRRLHPGDAALRRQEGLLQWRG